MVLVAILVLLWRATDGQEALRLLLSAEIGWLAAAALALTIQTVLSAQRWRLTARQLGIVIQPFEAVREYYLSQVINQSLPGGMIGDAGRAVRARGQAGLLMSSQAVVYERLAGQLGLVAVLVAALPLTLVLPAGFEWPVWLIAPVVGLLVIVLALPIGIVFALRFLGPGDHMLRRVVRTMTLALAARNVRARQVTLSLGTALCNLAAFAFCAAALGVTLPMLAVATLVPLILFAMLVPITISGWGVREGAAMLLLPLTGTAASEAFATSVAFGLIFILAVLPGFAFIWLRPNAHVIGQR